MSDASGQQPSSTPASFSDVTESGHDGALSSTASAPPAPPPPPAAPSTATVTTINKKWSIKMYIITLAMLVLGVWGLVDAIAVYPNRGARAAEYSEFQHLRDLKDSGRLANDLASIAEPQARLDELRTKERDGGGQGMVAGERARQEWLTQLKLIGKLIPQHTTYPRTDFRRDDAGKALAIGSADERLADLSKKFITPDGSAAKPPAPLSWYDVPSQWIIAAVGFGVAAYLVSLLLRVRSKTYRWEPSTKTLTLPGGQTLQPKDIAEFDKSKWDKLYIQLAVKPEHPTLGGKTLELDLLRYVPLEDWVLEMEKAGNA